MAKKKKTTKTVSNKKVVKTAHLTRGGRVCLTDTSYQKLNKNGDVKITETKVIRKPTKQLIDSVKKSNRKILN